MYAAQESPSRKRSLSGSRSPGRDVRLRDFPLPSSSGGFRYDYGYTDQWEQISTDPRGPGVASWDPAWQRGSSFPGPPESNGYPNFSVARYSNHPSRDPYGAPPFVPPPIPSSLPSLPALPTRYSLAEVPYAPHDPRHNTSLPLMLLCRPLTLDAFLPLKQSHPSLELRWLESLYDLDDDISAAARQLPHITGRRRRVWCSAIGGGDDLVRWITDTTPYMEWRMTFDVGELHWALGQEEKRWRERLEREDGKSSTQRERDMRELLLRDKERRVRKEKERQAQELDEALMKVIAASQSPTVDQILAERRQALVQNPPSESVSAPAVYGDRSLENSEFDEAGPSPDVQAVDAEKIIETVAATTEGDSVADVLAQLVPEDTLTEVLTQPVLNGTSNSELPSGSVLECVNKLIELSSHDEVVIPDGLSPLDRACLCPRRSLVQWAKHRGVIVDAQTEAGDQEPLLGTQIEGNWRLFDQPLTGEIDPRLQVLMARVLRDLPYAPRLRLYESPEAMNQLAAALPWFAHLVAEIKRKIDDSLSPSVLLST